MVYRRYLRYYFSFIESCNPLKCTVLQYSWLKFEGSFFGMSTVKIYFLMFTLDPIYTGLVTMVQVLYLLEICCPG